MSEPYDTDLNDGAWAIVEPHLPAALPGGRPRTTNLRAVVNAIFYLLRTGCQWRLLPRQFPPRSTVYHYFSLWRTQGVWTRLQWVLHKRVRAAAGRAECPTVVIMDGQSVKTTERGGTRGFDGHKRVKGRKTPCVTNTPRGKEVWCCTRDEGGPLGVGSQVQASNRCKLRPSRATVVSVAETSERDSGRWDPKRRARANRR